MRHALRAASGSATAASAIAARLVQVATLKLLRRSDYLRWRNPKSLETWWDSRTRLLAELVPAGTRVVEFGAGRCTLAQYLDKRCTYVPSDLVDRGPGTLVCDLNHRPLPDPASLRMDVAVFGGVLEYIVDVPAIVAWLAHSVRFCVASYARVTPPSSLRAGVHDRFWRTRHGYMNHFTDDQLVSLFRQRGFIPRTRRSWESQSLFLFEHTRHAATRPLPPRLP